MEAINLKTEYLTNHVGIDIVKPRLFWNCSGGMKQTAYQVICRDKNGNTLWDSHQTTSGSMRAEYAGGPLHSRTRVFWQVKLWDENGVPGEWSEQAVFEIGLLEPADWKARWITGDYRVNKKFRYPTDHFRTEFKACDVEKARLYVSACGLYTVHINGKRAGEFVCAPGHTDYRKRIQYQTIDVTALVQEGGNVLTAELADGWYRGAQGALGHTYVYGTQTKLICQLELTNHAGMITTICSNGSWQWSNDGARLFADLKDGEVVDANKTPSYSGKAREISFCGNLCCSDNFPVTRHEKFVPKLIITPSGKKVLDFGQNHSGFVGFCLQAHKGQKLFMRMGELLDKDGEFAQTNIQLSMDKGGERMEHVRWKNDMVRNVSQFENGKTAPLQMLEYTAKEGKNTYESEFALYGFRYALVETDITFEPQDFWSRAVYSDFEQTGSFTCSNELINRFVCCTLWSEKSNSADVPTDCPTRERSGWTGDAQIFFDTASYLTSYQPFARKFIRDMTDRQTKNGKFHQIVPKCGEDFWMSTMNDSVGWADEGVLIPYRMWKRYGDDRIIRENYEAMKRYAGFMMKRCGGWSPLQKPVKIKQHGKFLVNRGQSYGEWAEPDDVCAFSVKDFIFPHPEESTAYTYYTMEHMVEIAEYLGRHDDAKEYRRYADGCRKAYQALVEKTKFTLDTDRQAKLVRPLEMNLLTDSQKKYAQKRLVQAMENYHWRLGTGFLSTPFILDVLADIDVEYAYRLLENEECPGWLFMPKNGATTVWEAWEGNSTVSTGIASLNHYSKGAAVSWLFSAVCGIKVSGENHFVVSPVPGGTLTYANAVYDSVYGRVESGWQRENGRTYFDITIPTNCTAEIILPDGKTTNAAAGNLQFEI